MPHKTAGWERRAIFLRRWWVYDHLYKQVGPAQMNSRLRGPTQNTEVDESSPFGIRSENCHTKTRGKPWHRRWMSWLWPRNSNTGLHLPPHGPMAVIWSKRRTKHTASLLLRNVNQECRAARRGKRSATFSMIFPRKYSDVVNHSGSGFLTATQGCLKLFNGGITGVWHGMISLDKPRISLLFEVPQAEQGFLDK